MCGCTQRYYINPCTHKWIKAHPHVLQFLKSREKMAPLPSKKVVSSNPTPKKDKVGGAKAKQTTPKTEPKPFVVVKDEETKQSPAKTNGTKVVPDADMVFIVSPTEKAQQQHAKEAPKKETQLDPVEEASVKLPAPPGGKKNIISSSRLAADTVATTTTLGETLI
jgi:hypothetical protein